MIPYTENLKANKMNSAKLQGVRPTHKKSVVFLHTSNVPSKKEINYSFTVASKRIKYLGNNLTKEVKDLYTKNYKTEDLHK